MRYLLFLLLIPLLSPAHALVVLQYHHISTETPAITSVSPQQFIEHMDLLSELKLEVMDLELATHKVLAGEPLPDNAVAISFDDAYYSIYEHALPELQKRGWPFTVFINTQAVDEKNKLIMSWEQIQEMEKAGVALANHSVSHAHLTDIPAGLSVEQWLEQEIWQAQRRLEEKIPGVRKMLAYPYGEFTFEIAEHIIKAGYLAYGQQSGPLGPLSHPAALPRFPASGIYANPETLKTKLLSKALPVATTQLVSPLAIQSDNPPQLKFDFPVADIRWQQIQCFATGAGAIETQVEEKDGRAFVTTQANAALTGKRSRYNCTAPSNSGGYYWYSQPWQRF